MHTLNKDQFNFDYQINLPPSGIKFLYAIWLSISEKKNYQQICLLNTVIYIYICIIAVVFKKEKQKFALKIF